MPPVIEDQLPRILVERFVQTRGDPERGLTACLQSLVGL